MINTFTFLAEDILSRVNITVEVIRFLNEWNVTQLFPRSVAEYGSPQTQHDLLRSSVKGWLNSVNHHKLSQRDISSMASCVHHPTGLSQPQSYIPPDGIDDLLVSREGHVGPQDNVFCKLNRGYTDPLKGIQSNFKLLQ